jgi:hypothetical protein
MWKTQHIKMKPLVELLFVDTYKSVCSNTAGKILLMTHYCTNFCLDLRDAKGDAKTIFFTGLIRLIQKHLLSVYKYIFKNKCILELYRRNVKKQNFHQDDYVEVKPFVTSCALVHSGEFVFPIRQVTKRTAYANLT